MPVKKKIKLSKIIDTAIQNIADENVNLNEKKYMPDIITFCESPNYLDLKSKGIELRVAQRVVLKIFYRGSRGNENIKLTEEEIAWCKTHCIKPDEDNILEKYYTSEIFRELNLVWGRRCVSGDNTLVDPVSGKIWKIEDLWKQEKNINSWTYNEQTNKMEIVHNCHVINQGKRKVYKLTVESGQEIICTENHPLLVHCGYKKSSHRENGKRIYHTPELQKKWKELKDLNVGDSIAISSAIPFFGTSDAISEDEAALLGYMTGDGCCTSLTAFTCSCPIMLEDFRYRIGKISTNLKCYQDLWTTAKSKQYQYKISSIERKYEQFQKDGDTRVYNRNSKNDLCKLLVKHDLWGKTCHHKEVPKALYECPKNVIASYLRALFSCDGSIYFPSQSQNRPNQVRIEFYSVNKNQALAVRDLLLRFGICASVREKIGKTHIKRENKTYNSVSYRVGFYKRNDVIKFLNEISFIGRDDVIKTAKEKLLRASNTTDDSIYFNKIKSIEEAGEKDTFDLCVSDQPHLQNFVCNNILVHNSGKDFLAGVIASYEAMRLLECDGGNPYALYMGGLSTASPISILTIATAKDQANIAFLEIKDRILNSPYFRSKIGPEGVESSKIYLLTPHDAEQNKILASKGYPLKKGSVVVEVGHSNSDSLLGKSVFVLILDEVASYKETGGAGSGERIYTAMSPSLNTFTRSVTVVDENGNEVLGEDGKKIVKKVVDSKMIIISSPRGKSGLLWNIYEDSPKIKDRLSCRIPTWVANTNITEESLRETNKAMSEEQFMTEFGAEFSGTADESMFPRQVVEDAFKPYLQNKDGGEPGIVYFAHLDPATSSNNYALVVLHREIYYNQKTKQNDFKVIVDHIKFWHPSPTKPIDPDEIVDYVAKLKRKFYLGLVTFDMWHNDESKRMLTKQGIPHKMTHFGKRYKMIIYGELLNLLLTGRIEIPPHSLLRGEMINLQKKFTQPTGFSVFARSDGEYSTDDVVDALAGACYSSISVGASHLPISKLVNTGILSSGNQRQWNSMSGPMGFGTGAQVASNLERKKSWPNSKRM